MSLNIKLFFLIVISIFALEGCNAISESNNQEKKHIMYDSSAEVLNNFSEEEKTKILDAFNVVIPDKESAAYIYAFSKIECNDNRSSTVNFIIEIDGVEDSDAFYESNQGRVAENGLYGLSENELFGKSTQDYFITYSEVFYTEIAEDSELYTTLSSLFNEIAENH